MALFTTKSFGCICDGCGEHFISSNEGYSLFVDELSAREHLEDDGWHEINGKWYCPDCCEYDEEKDEYVPILDQTE